MMNKEEMDYQVTKAIEFIERGGDFEIWLESKDFVEEEVNYIRNHSKIIEKLSKRI